MSTHFGTQSAQPPNRDFGCERQPCQRTAWPARRTAFRDASVRTHQSPTDTAPVLGAAKTVLPIRQALVGVPLPCAAPEAVVGATGGLGQGDHLRERQVAGRAGRLPKAVPGCQPIPVPHAQV